MKPYRTKEKCANCPFHSSGEGLRLRKSLNPGRWKEITDGLRNQEWFACHKTTIDCDDDDGESVPGSGLICSGSIEWQEKRGISSNFLRICERIREIGERRTMKERITHDT